MNLLGFCAKIKVENQMGFSAGGSFWAKTKVGFLSWKNSRCCCCMMGTEQQRCQRERERGARGVVRGVAGVARATPIFLVLFHKTLSPKTLKHQSPQAHKPTSPQTHNPLKLSNT